VLGFGLMVLLAGLAVRGVRSVMITNVVCEGSRCCIELSRKSVMVRDGMEYSWTVLFLVVSVEVVFMVRRRGG